MWTIRCCSQTWGGIRAQAGGSEEAGSAPAVEALDSKDGETDMLIPLFKSADGEDDGEAPEPELTLEDIPGGPGRGQSE